jgi:hypothetical protein
LHGNRSGGTENARDELIAMAIAVTMMPDLKST